MKVFFINNGMTHYYNQVLNKLCQAAGVELILVIPKRVSNNIGEGVYQTREGVCFRVIELKEYKVLGIFPSFRGLTSLFLREKPDVVIAADIYLFPFLFSIPLVLTRKFLRMKLIMKSIPFRIPTYQEAKLCLRENPQTIEWIPRTLNTVFAKLGLLKILQRVALQLRKIGYNIPDAHVNYVDEAYDIYGSYGVPQRKIFITRNSPDTDMLFAVRDSLESSTPILPACGHRLVHVGRLVPWKRVDMLLRAFSRIKQQYNDAELLIIGTGPEEMRLKDLCAKLQMNHAVKFLGGIYDPRVLGQYLISSTVYVLAGMGGLSINEAMCFGLPVICSVCDGTEKMLVKDEINGKYFRDGSEDDLVKTIAYLFGNPALTKKMGNNSTDIIRKEINIHVVIDGYVRALRYVCQSSAEISVFAKNI